MKKFLITLLIAVASLSSCDKDEKEVYVDPLYEPMTGSMASTIIGRWNVFTLGVVYEYDGTYQHKIFGNVETKSKYKMYENGIMNVEGTEYKVTFRSKNYVIINGDVCLIREGIELGKY